MVLLVAVLMWLRLSVLLLLLLLVLGLLMAIVRDGIGGRVCVGGRLPSLNVGISVLKPVNRSLREELRLSLDH